MASQSDEHAPIGSSITTTTTSTGAAFPWILEHILAHPGSYEIDLRQLYALNSRTITQQSTPVSPTQVPGNAFTKPQQPGSEKQQHLKASTAQLRANLMVHISQLPSQPTSLPPSFITSFVRKCFTQELSQVEFSQSLAALDYLRDLEHRRRAELVAALNKLGIDREDLVDRERMMKKYPGVLQWVDSIEEKEKKVEAIYSQVYVGLRRWILVNEMSLEKFSKANCIAMLNTLYPPMMPAPANKFVQPTTQLTATILSEQRNAFFRYIMAVEKKGPSVLSGLIVQHKRPGDENGWPTLRENLDSYLRLAINIIDECNEITGRCMTPVTASFSSVSADSVDESRRKVDSGISFGSGRSSNRSSGQSNLTRPSTSSSMSSHTRQFSKEKSLPEKPLPSPGAESQPPSPKPAGSTLERIARELRRMRSKSSVREESKARPATSYATVHDTPASESEPFQLGPAPGKGLRFKRSLRKMRSSGGMRERSDSTSRPTSRADDAPMSGVPAFDADEMRLRRQAWEASQEQKATHLN